MEMRHRPLKVLNEGTFQFTSRNPFRTPLKVKPTATLCSCALRCLLERDPIARKHAARLKRFSGTYDRYGNRRPPPTIVTTDEDGGRVRLGGGGHETPRRRRKSYKGRCNWHSYRDAFNLPTNNKNKVIISSIKVSDHDSEEELASPRRAKGGGSRQSGKRPMTAKPKAEVSRREDKQRKSKAAASRPKSAPKFRGQKAEEEEEEEGSSEVPEVDEYSSVQDESSEEDIPLPEEELDGSEEASEVSEDESVRDGHRNDKVR